MAKNLTNYQIASNHEEWERFRANGLGGSDIGALLGLNKYKSKYELFLEKTGSGSKAGREESIPIKIGNRLESLVAEMFTNETGLKVYNDRKTYYHKDHPFLLANIDYKITGERALLECKTTSAFLDREWNDDEVPASYLCQIQHYLNVLDYDYAYIAVLIGNAKFIYKKVERDDEFIRMYTKEAIDFWKNNVLMNKPPAIDEGIISKNAINFIANESTESKPATIEQINKIREIIRLDELTKDYKAQSDSLKNQLKADMANCDVAELISNEFKVTWKKYTQNRFDSTVFKKDYPDLYKQYSKTSASQRLTIKELV